MPGRRPTSLLVRATILACAFTVIVAGRLFGQDSRIRAGDRVRVVMNSLSRTYDVDSVSGQVLLGRDEHGVQVALPLARVDRVSVYRGRIDRRDVLEKYGRIGLLTVGIIGFGTGLAIGGDDFLGISRFEMGVYGGLAGGAAGLAVGFAAGFITPVERWERIPLDGARLGVARDGGLAVAYTVRF